jgi:phosphoglycerate dehydrogenase-like enzyme
VRKVLVNFGGINPESLHRLSKIAEVVESQKFDEATIVSLLPQIDAAVVLSWPSFLTRENLARMGRLGFIQTVMVGVNHVPFRDLPRRVVVCNNSGAYSTEVGEHAWGLLLSAAKKIVTTYASVKEGGKTIGSFAGEERSITVLEGKTMGVVGYGGIGRMVAKYARAFGMKVVAFNRSRRKDPGVTFLYGREGLEKVLATSDAVLISLPLTKSTDRLIGASELGLMKRDAILVNVARGDILDQVALYNHLVANPSFRYATDAWWFKEGKETLETEGPFTSLPNFVGTPHTSGPTGLARGEPQRIATENTIRYLRGLKPRNIVNRLDYSEV